MTGKLIVAVTAVLLLCILPHTVWASIGDQSQHYENCLTRCHRHNCSKTDLLAKFDLQQPVVMKLLLWTCIDECKYSCMWATVDAFNQTSGFIPQFYGKWPFLRFWGLQEPASVFFSLLNGLAHFLMWQSFKSQIPSTSPMYGIWRLYAWASVHAWTWSAIFHTRDVPFTEKLDYFCATSSVLYCLFALCRRLLLGKSMIWSGLVAALCSIWFAYHVYYLSAVRFDYGYNMKVNILIGLLNTAGWLAWSAGRWRRNHRYVWRGAATVVAVNLLLLLEVGDFPPYLWIFDAHSLWHLGTAPLPILWYKFLADDCRHLMHDDEKTRKLV